MDYIFIAGNVPSSKNSKVKGKNGIFHSPAVRKYLQILGVKRYSPSRKFIENYKTRPNLFSLYENDFRKQFIGKEPPFIIGVHFVRKTKSDFDFHNICHLVFDLMVAHKFIEDDCMRYLIPVPMKIDDKFYSINPKNPGVYIKVFNSLELK